MRCVSCSYGPGDIVGAPDAADHFIEVAPGEIRCTSCIYLQVGAHPQEWLTGILASLNRRARQLDTPIPYLPTTP